MAVDLYTSPTSPSPPPDQGVAPQDDDPQAVVNYWLDQIERAQRGNFKAWQTRGRQITKRYKNKRTLPVTGVPLAARRMNVLWSNVQTLKPVLYSQTPKANVSRRNKTKDPLGRMASIVLQNVLQNSLGMEDFDLVMKQAIEDRLLPGQGTCMVEYIPQIEEDEIGWQAAETRYVHWEDCLTNPARTWQEVDWWAYRSFLTRAEAVQVVLSGGGSEELAADVQRELVLDHTENNKDKNQQGIASKAVVWCIWDKTTKQVYQIATGYPKAPLATLPPPVAYDGFFPVPRPLVATTSNDSTIPVPDFDQYVDQADEIDMLTQRIGLLAKALRLRGFYPADMESIKTLMENTTDNDLVPVSNWAMFNERGGAQNVIGWVPIKDVATTLQACYEARDKAIEIMYEVTGISDIMRGATEASETATAQQLKAQFGGVRVRETQQDVQRFIRDLLRKKAEVISEHFELQVIQAMAGVKLLTNQQKQMVQQAQMMWQKFGQAQQQAQAAAQQAQQQGMQPPPPPQPPQVPQPSPDMIKALAEPSWEDVMGLLRNEKLRGFVIDVETDSTIEPDQQSEQQSAVNFVTAVTQFMGAAAQIAVTPMGMQAMPLMGEMLAWATRRFKAADTLEQSIDEFVDQIDAMAKQPQQPQPNPEVMRAQADVEATKAKSALDQQKTQNEIQVANTKARNDLTVQREKIAADRETELTKHATQLASEERRHAAEQETARYVATQEGAAQLAGEHVKNTADKANQHLTEVVAQAMQAMADAASNQAQTNDQLKTAILAPTVIDRDENGRPTGSRKVIQ